MSRKEATVFYTGKREITLKLIILEERKFLKSRNRKRKIKGKDSYTITSKARNSA